VRGPSRELRVIFAEEFRRQVRRPGFAFFTLFFPLLMLIAIPVTPFVVDLIQDDAPADTGVVDEARWNDVPAELETFRYRGIVEADSAVPAEEDWLRNPANGHYYRLTMSMNWMQAEAQAIDWGGHLVTVNDREEELWLRSQFGVQEALWLGFNDLAREGNWEWVSGEPSVYANWASGQPDDYQDNEDAAIMNWQGLGDEDPPLATVGYVDPAGILPGPGSQDAPTQYSDLSEGIQAVQQGEIEVLFVLPADYLESGGVAQYRASGEGDGGLTGRIWGSAPEWAFRDFLRGELIAGQVDADVLARALQPADYLNFEIGDDGAISEAVPFAQELGELLVPLLFGFLLIIAVLTGSSTLSSSVAEEKETRMIEMLVTSASPLSIMSAKLLSLGFAGLIQIAVWVTVGAFALPAIFDRIPNGGELTVSAGLLALVVMAFVLGYFLFSALALFIATLVPSTQDAQRQTGLLTMFMFVPVWFIGLFMNQPDGAFAQILTYFPFTSPTMLMVRLGMGSDMSGGEIAASLAIVAATALLLLWVAARVFRAGILLSGQRITGRNVWTALRHAD
jgi:ABC-2 type transport system permease protein